MRTLGDGHARRRQASLMRSGRRRAGRALAWLLAGSAALAATGGVPGAVEALAAEAPLATPAGGVGPAVAAASDLKFALDEVAALFRQRTGQAVRITYGSSGNFFRQISQGAPFELFLSADEQLVERLAQAGLTQDAGALYAVGRIALFVPAGSPVRADAELSDLREALADGRLRRLAIANPEHAPYGRAAREALVHAGLWEAAQPKLVLGENVSQAAQFAASGSAQAGIVALSLARAPAFASVGSHALVPATWHRPLRQRMVLLRGATPAAQALYAFLGEPPARAILERYGFALPQVP